VDLARENRIDITAEMVGEHEAPDDELTALERRYAIAAAAHADATTPAARTKAEQELDRLDAEIAKCRRNRALAEAAERGRRLKAAEEERRRREEEHRAAEATVEKLATQRFALARKLDQATNEQVATLAEFQSVCDEMSDAAIPLGGRPHGWNGRHAPQWISGRLATVARREFELPHRSLQASFVDVEREKLVGLLDAEGGEQE
jgi:hypothetical protein